jgi:hypothetical protein
MADEVPKAAPKVGPLKFSKGMLLRKFRIDASDSGWGILTGTYRPATPREAREYAANLAEVGKDSPDQRIAAQAAFYASLLKSWNAVNDDDTEMAITPASVAALPLPFWDQMESVVLGYTAEPMLGN